MQLPDWKYWLYQRGIDVDRFDVRETLNQNPQFVLIGVGAIALVCLLLVVCQFSGGSTMSVTSYKVIYYDTSNQTLRVVEHEISQGMHTSPLKGTDDVFEAMLFYCGEQPEGLELDGMSRKELEETGVFIGWLQKIDPEAVEDAFLSEGHMYRAVDGKDWIPVYEEKVEEILNAPYERCNDARPFQIR